MSIIFQSKHIRISDTIRRAPLDPVDMVAVWDNGRLTCSIISVPFRDPLESPRKVPAKAVTFQLNLFRTSVGMDHFKSSSRLKLFFSSSGTRFLIVTVLEFSSRPVDH